MGPLHAALADLGAAVTSEARNVPVTFVGPLTTVVPSPGRRRLEPVPDRPHADRAAPRRRSRLELTTPLVSAPYVRLTAHVMAAFGVDGVTSPTTPSPSRGRYAGPSSSSRMRRPPVTRWRSPPSPVGASGGGLHRCGPGRRRRRRPPGPDGLHRRRPRLGRPHRRAALGVDVDMADVSDLVPTIAAVAATATTPTTYPRRRLHPRQGERPARRPRRGAGHARRSVEVTMTACASSRPLHGAMVDTHHDHRLAMAFGVLAAVVPASGRRPRRRHQELARLLGGPRRRSSETVVVAFDVDGTLTNARLRHAVPPARRRYRWPDGGGLARSRRGRRRRGSARPRRSKAVAARVVFAGRSVAQTRGSRAGRSPPGIAADRLREDRVARLALAPAPRPPDGPGVGVVRRVPAAAGGRTSAGEGPPITVLDGRRRRSCHR